MVLPPTHSRSGSLLMWRTDWNCRTRSHALPPLPWRAPQIPLCKWPPPLIPLNLQPLWACPRRALFLGGDWCLRETAGDLGTGMKGHLQLWKGRSQAPIDTLDHQPPQTTYCPEPVLHWLLLFFYHTCLSIKHSLYCMWLPLCQVVRARNTNLDSKKKIAPILFYDGQNAILVSMPNVGS